MPGSIVGEGGSRFGTLPSELVTPRDTPSQTSVLPAALRSRMMVTPSAGDPRAVSSTWLVTGDVSGFPSAYSELLLLYCAHSELLLLCCTFEVPCMISFANWVIHNSLK